jgi:hypothetical protein
VKGYFQNQLKKKKKSTKHKRAHSDTAFFRLMTHTNVAERLCQYTEKCKNWEGEMKTLSILRFSGRQGNVDELQIKRIKTTGSALQLHFRIAIVNLEEHYPEVAETEVDVDFHYCAWIRCAMSGYLDDWHIFTGIASSSGASHGDQHG